jgi:flagellar basal-body rod protein FlgB
MELAINTQRKDYLKNGEIMLSDILFKNTTQPAVNKMLDASMLRSRVISNNIANVNTPGYRRVEVSFEDELRNALDRTRLQGTRTDENHLDFGRKDISQVNARAYHPYDPTQPSGVNNVDIDMEMAKLAEAQITYNYGVKFGQNMFRRLNAAIQQKDMPLQ